MVDAQITFVRGSDKKVDEIVLHQNGRDTPAQRVTQSATTQRPLGEYVGAYTSDELDATANVYLEDGKLWTRVGYSAPLPLEPIGGDEFSAGFATVRAIVDADDRVRALLLDAGRVRGIRFEKQ